MIKLLLCMWLAAAVASGPSLKYLTIYNEIESRGYEVGVCRDLTARQAAARQREFERDGEVYGHLVREVRPGVFREFRGLFIPDVNEKIPYIDKKTKTHFINPLRTIVDSNNNAGKPYFRSKESRTTVKIEGWESIKPVSFTYETEGKLFKGRSKAKGVLSIEDNKYVDLRAGVDLKKFQLVRIDAPGLRGLTYEYRYTGEIHVPTDRINRQVKPKVTIIQSLLPTHFLDAYEMNRVFPFVDVMRGKVHNIETVLSRQEQNLFGVTVSVFDEDTATLQNSTVIRFEVPVLIHSTVLPPSLENSVDTYIPKNAKIYVNFLAEAEPELYATDCLMQGWACVGMADNNIHRQIVESRFTVNLKMKEVCLWTTLGFALVGLLYFVKLIVHHDTYYVDVYN